MCFRSLEEMFELNIYIWKLLTCRLVSTLQVQSIVYIGGIFERDCVDYEKDRIQGVI